MNHVILGAGGSIGNALAHELIGQNENVRLVSRNQINIPGTTHYRADLTDPNSTIDAVKGANVVHLCAGLPYEYKIWKDTWPLIMKNVLEACKVQRAKLIFFDNVYMYGKVDGKMTEDTPYNPCSKKGEVRAHLANMLDEEYQKGDLKVISARAADLYGPYITGNSVPYFLAFEKMMQGKKPQWMLNNNQVHSYTFTSDCAKAMYLLSKNDDAFNQTWHLPTFNPPIDGKHFIELIADALQMDSAHSILKKWMINMVAPFNKTIGEITEMLYQYENPYYFDSTKFEQHFNFKPTSMEQGIEETIAYLKTNRSD